jgi:hypothetical protein
MSLPFRHRMMERIHGIVDEWHVTSALLMEIVQEPTFQFYFFRNTTLITSTFESVTSLVRLFSDADYYISVIINKNLSYAAI